MVSFPDYIRQRLENNGYECVSQTGNDVFMREISYLPKPDNVWICYLETEITPEQIRRCFEFPGHILFVVKESLIPQEIVSRTETPMWLRVLHGLYMGRVYVWNDRHLFGLHFDYDSGDVSESGVIQPDELLLVETGTWLRGWTGVYRLARFYDRAWWNEKESFHDTYTRYKAEQEQKDKSYYYGNWTAGDEQKSSSSRQSYEQARDNYQRQQQERERAKGTRWEGEPPKWGYDTPKQPPKSDDSNKRNFMREFAQAGSPSAVKALFRKLAKEFHPDLNPGVDTTEIMQQVNAAYERWK